MRTALVAGGRTLTFGELRAAAGRVAASLRADGVGVEDVVALRLPRGADLVVALLGVLTAGAAYLPVDPALPERRQRLLVESAGVARIIDDGRSPAPSAAVRRLGIASLDAPAGPAIAPRPVPPAALAYVIHTSGSTGEPKGVSVSRGAVAGLLAALERAGLTGDTPGRVGWNAPAAFDASVQQWVRLCRGDTVVLVDEPARADPTLLADLVEEAALTSLDLTPTHAGLFLDAWTPGPAREPLTLLIGGEPIPPALWTRVASLAAAGLIRPANVYGPTEATVDATSTWIAAGDLPHLGTALDGLRVRILGDDLRPAAEGEIHLSGPRLARGYRHRPGHTAERFVADPAGTGGRMYRTGDRARRHADGRLEFLGRRDGQVKIRGYRVELGEIAAVLGRHPDVAHVAVLLREHPRTGPALVAYYLPRTAIGPGELRRLAARHLPAYLVPAAFVEVDTFPTTPSGKLDPAALPAGAYVPGSPSVPRLSG